MNIDNGPAAASSSAARTKVVYDYVTDVDPNLICAICQCALVDPVTTACSHTFCRTCIVEALHHAHTCPIDRAPLSEAELRDSGPLVRTMLDELRVRCGMPGCGKEMDRALLVSHLRSCGGRTETCPRGCGVEFAPGRTVQHHAYDCFRRKMACTQCGQIVTFQAEKEGKHRCDLGSPQACAHCGQAAPTPTHKWSCPAVPVPCLHQTWGCSAIIPRQDLESHLTTCTYEPLKPYLEANHARLTSIERRQALLEAENLELKAQLAGMTGDPLSLIGLFLSPTDFFRSSIRRMSVHDQPDLRHAASSSSFNPAGSVRDMLSGPNGDRPVTPLVSSVLTSEPPTISVRRDSNISLSSVSESDGALSLPRSDSAASLPPPRPERHADRPRSRPVSERRMSRPTLPTAPVTANSAPPAPASRRQQTHQDWVLDRLPEPGTRFSRETQQALRAAILHLATGLDAAEQRSALRTMTSSLRVMEEVEALRAIVSPMRMQFLSEPPASRSSVSSTSEELHTPLVSDDEASIQESVVFTPGVGTSTSTVISGGGRWTGRPCAFPPPNSSMPTPMSSRSHSALGVHGPGHRSASALGTHQPGPSAVHITRHSVRTSRPGRSTSDSGSGGSGESGGRSEGSTSTIRQADARPQRTVRHFRSISALGSRIRGRFDRNERAQGS